MFISPAPSQISALVTILKENTFISQSLDLTDAYDKLKDITIPQLKFINYNFHFGSKLKVIEVLRQRGIQPKICES